MRTLFVFSETSTPPATATKFAEYIADQMQFELKWLMPSSCQQNNADVLLYDSVAELNDLIEQHDAAMIVYEIDNNKKIQSLLNQSRNFRIPYLFVRPEYQINFSKVVIPVTFLEEDREKAPFASAFGRFCHSSLTIVQPKDYGSKAKQNIDILKRLFDSFELKYDEIESSKDSYHVENDTAMHALADGYGLVIISASREYGLDDIIFGSKEKKILAKSQTPILVINPRGDLYALCD